MTRLAIYARAAKGLKPMNPHSLRHACATHMLNNGAPLVVIKELLGHAKLSTTAQYAFVSTGLMQKTYNAAHPSCRRTQAVVRQDVSRQLLRSEGFHRERGSTIRRVFDNGRSQA